MIGRVCHLARDSTTLMRPFCLMVAVMNTNSDDANVDRTVSGYSTLGTASSFSYCVARKPAGFWFVVADQAVGALEH